MQKKKFLPEFPGKLISRLIRYFRGCPENYNPDQAETAKFGIGNFENIFWNEFTKMQKKKICPGISRYIRYFRGNTENNNPDQAETAKFGISKLENIYWNKFTKMLKKKISPGISR